eukprot:763552-Hanusia_phi.AAC.3
MPFFTAYSILSSRILINVVVAVLLDNFIRCVKEEERKEMQRSLEKERQGIELSSRVLDPLMKFLAKHDTEQHFKAQVQMIFNIINFQLKERVNFEDMHKGLKGLGFKPLIELRKDDFDYITAEGRFCNELGELTAQQFFAMISRQYRMFCARKLCDLQKMSDGADSVVHLATKMVLVMEDPGWENDALFRWTARRGKEGEEAARKEEEGEEGDVSAHRHQPENLHDLPKEVLIENLERIKQERNEYKFQLQCMQRRAQVARTSPPPPLLPAHRREFLEDESSSSPIHVNRFVPTLLSNTGFPVNFASWMRTEDAGGVAEGQARSGVIARKAGSLFVA